MKHRFVDKEKYERADREARLIINAERQSREEKTARLREQRLAQQRPGHDPEYHGRGH